MFLPAHQLAKGIRDRAFSSVEVLDAHLQQIAQYNGKLNAIVTLNEVQARQQAKAADVAIANGEVWGGLHGVPFTVKDYIATAGLRTTSSYPPLANYVPQVDATVVARLRSAGAILLGKTNLPQLASGFQSDSPLFGRANNPWNLAWTPGGSTGGGAAAVAAGLSPLEIGGDLGGSIRIPAHFCGIFGLKPTEYRVSNAGVVGRKILSSSSVRHLRVLGPLARSVEDLRLCLSLIEGADNRDWQVQLAPKETISQRSLNAYRFAWMDDFGGIPVSAETRAVLEKLALQLEEMGCRVERCSPSKFDFAAALRTYGEIAGTEMGASAPLVQQALFPLLSSILSPLVAPQPLVQGFLSGATLNFQRYRAALTRRDVLIGQVEAFFEDWDAWLCPVTCGSTFPHVKLRGNFDSIMKTLKVDDQTLPYNVWGLSHCPIANLTGNPAIAIPVGQTQAGLPLGIQIIGKRWSDLKLLTLAQQLADMIGEPQRPRANK